MLRMSSVDYQGSPHASSADSLSAEQPEVLATDDDPSPSSPMHQTVPGIDLTGATISQEWSMLPDGAKDGESDLCWSCY